ncbi:XdhC family aldehyde oxidoreductase maturation factor [Desulforapulum autotrophicum]|nr:XdhC/CoxI family protein [Desulforapulum autotrophicum]
MSKNDKAVWESLNQGTPVVMATILSKQGSAPRSAGTKMVVHGDGSISGTIGGGWIEARVQDLAGTFFKTRTGALIQEFTLDARAYADMDMVCGGDVTLLLEYLPATALNLEFFQKRMDLEAVGQNGFLASRLAKQPDGSYTVDRFLISGQEQTGPFALSQASLIRLSDQAEMMRSPGLIYLDDGTFFIEPARFNGTLYILGAGHLAIETARLAAHTGFKPIVMDDRKEFANNQRFPMADTHVLDNFDGCFDGFTIGEGSYIVIMTRGHLYDRTILEQALETRATYIGMIGSRSKRKIIYDYLLSQGVSQSRLDTIHAPIGLAINAQTPEEIAVSIVAELIQERFNAV